MLKKRLLDYCRRYAAQKVLVVVDDKVRRLYASIFETLPSEVACFLYSVEGAESAKSIDEVTKIWNFLLQHNFSKSDLVLNVGGGSVCDLGGFAAATYKRGIPCVNLPTTLLAMVDAAYGGKNGVNVGDVKNAVGTIVLPREVWRDENFLDTLSHTDLLNGFAEVMKCALIANRQIWKEILKLEQIDRNSIRAEWIDFAVNFKQQVVEQDLNDTGHRHLLNFGHTMGHAYESHFLEMGTPQPHGFCVAYGIVDAAEISYRTGLLNLQVFEEIKGFVEKFYGLPDCPRNALASFCVQDKKNRDGKVLFVLLEDVGSPILDCEVNLDMLKHEME